MVVADWQPRGTHALAQEIDAVDPSALHVLTYSDIQYSFIEGSWATFGRDDAECSVPIWEALQGSELSRVAGVLWCIDGELWVRNLSQTHELVVTGGSTPHHLPPRPGSRRGAACTLPADRAMISAPSTGDWRITTMSMSRSQPDPALVPATVTLTRPPQALLPHGRRLVCAAAAARWPTGHLSGDRNHDRRQTPNSPGSGRSPGGVLRPARLPTPVATPRWR